MEILGSPMVTLEVATDQPVAIIAVRLNNVAPGGASTRVTYWLSEPHPPRQPRASATIGARQTVPDKHDVERCRLRVSAQA